MNGVALAIVLVFVSQFSSSLWAQSQQLLARIEAARQRKAQGSAQQALQAYGAILPEVRSAGQPSLLAEVLGETSQTAVTVGNYALGIQYGSESAAISGRTGDIKTAGLAFNSIGLANLYQGTYPAALAAFQRSLELAEAGNDAEAASVRLCNIGIVHFFQGQYLDALQSYERALRKSEQLASAMSNGRQLALGNLAVLYEQLGQNEVALGYYRRAQAAAAALRSPEYAQLLSNIGTLYRRMGDPVKALQMYQEALRVFARTPHSDGQTRVLENIGIVYALDYKKPTRALESFTEALHLAETSGNRRQIVAAHLFRGEALFRLGLIRESGEAYETALAGAADIGAVEEQWTAYYGLGRAQQHGGQADRAQGSYQKAIAVIENIRGGLGVASLKSEFLANKRNVYDAYIAAVLGSGSRDDGRMFELFEQARSRNLQEALHQAARNTNLRAIRERLDPGSMLVEFWLGESEMAALWISRERTSLIRKDLTPEDLAALRSLGEGLAESDDASWRQRAQRAGMLLLSGAPLSPDVSHLFIVPDGILSSLPFEILPVGVSAPLLVERVAVSYLPSGALLIRPEPRRRRMLPWNSQFVGFGDPLSTSKDQITGDPGWNRLPDSAREVRAIASELPGRSELHLGTDNLKRHLLGQAALRGSVLHLSTHAAADTLEPARSRILFTPEGRAESSKYLFWKEVQSLSLTGVELVTLSACETEGGKLVPGEGIQSFSRAFLAAGADATVTALWRVADGPTAEFMSVFYRYLARGTSKAEALRQAKLAFLRPGSSFQAPRFWAAFVLNGDGRESLTPVVSWSSLVIGVGVIALAAIGLRRAWGRRPRRTVEIRRS